MSQNTEIANPLVEQRADPWIYRHTDGFYYFTASVPEYDRIELRRSKTLQGLKSAEPFIAMRQTIMGAMSKNLWAPEIHYIDGHWYIYFAAAREDSQFDERVYVLENLNDDPFTDDWTFKGQIDFGMDTFALDTTSFTLNGKNYLVWAQRDPKVVGNSNLYIAQLKNPWTIKGVPVMLTKPELAWEIRGFLVNEGPAVLIKNERLFLTYSASATDERYCMGMLTASAHSNLLNPSSWVKSPKPIFTTCAANSQFGPGHNSFTVTPEGKDVLVYHARNYKDIVGDPLYDPNRHTRVQLVNWDSSGNPVFGNPIPDGTVDLK